MAVRNGAEWVLEARPGSEKNKEGDGQEEEPEGTEANKDRRTKRGGAQDEEKKQRERRTGRKMKKGERKQGKERRRKNRKRH